MIFYDISDLERLSGIKSHTIRMWEKRYNLLKPHRTSTNIRRYTDDDLRKLLNVRTLLDAGWKISKIASCSEKEIIRSIQKIYEEKNQTEHFYYQYFINELIYYGVVFDEENFERIYLNAVNRFGVIETVKHIVYPLLRKVGLMWEINEIPAQEHFITNIIRKKLITAVDTIPFSKKSKILLFYSFHPENIMKYHLFLAILSFVKNKFKLFI